jgi:hypothetical protein
MFSGSTGISGSLVSFGRGLGVTLTAGTSWTWVFRFDPGSAAGHGVAAVIKALDAVNPIHQVGIFNLFGTV